MIMLPSAKPDADVRSSSVKFVKCNVTVWADQLAVFKTAIASSPSGRVDIVIANAGISGGDAVFFNDRRWFNSRIKQHMTRLTSMFRGSRKRRA